MKKNKILKFVCSLVLCLTVGLAFMGCDVNEVKEATTAGIEASTNILPVEYSQEVAQSTLVGALSNSLQQEGYKTTYLFCSYLNEIPATSFNAEVTCSKNEDSISYKIVRGGNTYYYTKMENDYYFMGYMDYQMSYIKTTSLSSLDGVNQMMLPMYTTLIPNVVNGKYYKGAEHVYASFTQGSTTILYEFVIKDNLIIQINATSYSNVPSANYFLGINTMDIEYGEQTIEDLPTSLNGYTEKSV